MMNFPMLTLRDPDVHTTVHIRLDLVMQCVECLDEAGNSIVELVFANWHREVYGARTAQPLVSWFAAQAERYARAQRVARPSWDARLQEFEALIDAAPGLPDVLDEDGAFPAR